jgi:outer membrane protein assembly factor BamE (lipoprotein component of BamABCDE complex)
MAQSAFRSTAIRHSGLRGRASRLALVVTGACLLAACQPEIISRGYQIDDKALEQVRVGSSAEQVLLVLGTPSTTSTVGGKTYYYISQRLTQRFQFMEPTIADQRVVAIYLDQRNKVERVANYGLKDGVVFDFISRTTPTGGEELSFLRQVLRGATQFNPL